MKETQGTKDTEAQQPTASAAAATADPIFSSKDYRRSRTAYKWECAFEYFVALLVSDAFLAKILTSTGMSDGLAGVIASFISLAFLFQLLSLFVVQHIRNVKVFAILFHSLSQLFFMSLYLIPFLPFAKEYKHVLLFICILLAYFGNYMVSSIIFKWGNSYVDPRKRGAFSAGKEMISLATGMAMTLILGNVMDAFERADNLYGGFLFAAIAILIFALSDFLCLMSIKNQKRSEEELRASKVPLREVLRNTLGNRNFRSILFLAILWNVASYTTVGFLGVYRLNDLGFTVGIIQLINIGGNLGRFIATKPFGRFSDRHSYARGMELGFIISAVAFSAVIFTSPATRWLIIAYTVLHSVSMAGINANMYNVIYSYVDERYFVQASAIKNSIGGICGFCAALAAKPVLEAIQANGNTLFGIPVYGQQLLASITLFLVIGCILYTHFVIAKQKVMVQ